MSERSFLDYMEYMYRIGKCETCCNLTIPELFDFSKQDVDRQVDENKRLFKVSGHPVTMLGFYETKIEIIKELEKLKSEVSEEIYSRIELLIIASFRVGQDTESHLASAIIGGLKGPQVKKIYNCSSLGKGKGPNPVLVKAINNMLKKTPSIEYRQVEAKLITNAQNMGYWIDGYEITFQEKGSEHYEKILPRDSLIFIPSDPENAQYGTHLQPVGISSLRRYYDNVKKNIW